MNHTHSKKHHHGHSHDHGSYDPSLLRSQKGIWCVKWSIAVLIVTVALEFTVILISGSTALLAHMVHKLGDVLTAIPLLIAFWLLRFKPSKRFPDGYGRLEDITGIFIIVILLGSAVFAGFESIERLLHPQDLHNLWAVMGISILGIVGNEFVARFRIKVGLEIASTTLVADGYHARADALVSLAVLLGATAVALGYPVADPVIGIFISILIMVFVFEVGKSVFTRIKDGVGSDVIHRIQEAALAVKGVSALTEVRVRLEKKSLHAEIGLKVSDNLSSSDIQVLRDAVTASVRDVDPRHVDITLNIVD